MAEKIKMVFKEDKYIRVMDKKLNKTVQVVFAKAGESVEVEKDSVARWMKRGGVIAGSKEDKANI